MDRRARLGEVARATAWRRARTGDPTPSLYDLDVKWIGTAVALLAISIGGVAWALKHQDHSNNQPLQPFG